MIIATKKGFNKVLSFLILLLLQCHGQKYFNGVNVQKEVKM